MKGRATLERLILSKEIRDIPQLRESFFALAERVFSLSFRGWYEKGYWGSRYQPYTLSKNQEVLANASVNIMEFLYHGVPKLLIQIGTVMTAPEERGKGYARRLIEEILRDWRGRCDGIFLFANDSVLNFYPKFRFRKVSEYQTSISVLPRPGDFEKLDLSPSSHLALWKEAVALGNPYAKLALKDSFGLLMFHCGDSLKDCVYYSPSERLAAIARHEGNSLLCYDIFGPCCSSLDDVLSRLAPADIRNVRLGFSPKGKEYQKLNFPFWEEDTTLFWLEETENPLERERLMLPLLSHA